MSEDDNHPPMARRVEQNLGVIVLLLLLVGAFLVLQPFISALAWAFVMASTLWAVRRQLVARFNGRRTLAAFTLSSSIALVQGAVAFIGFAIAGVPGAVLLGFLTFLASPVPVGPPLVWIPATLWLFHQGQTGWAIFMAIWGIGVVSMIDNIVKPLIISKGSDTPFILILCGVIGGAMVFGFIGVFLGPTLLAVMYRLIADWSKAQSPAEEAVETVA